MMRGILVGLALLAGCDYPRPQPYTWPGGQPYPNPPGIAAGTPTYQIDSAINTNTPYGSYGITTNSLTWYLEWEVDDAGHSFTGDVYCPVGCGLDKIMFSGSKMAITQVAANHFHFDVMTPAKSLQQLQFDVPTQPLSLDLKIDGHPALAPGVTFPAGGKLVTVDAMPINLVSTYVPPR